MKPEPLIIALDFDGVMHDVAGAPWAGNSLITGPPVAGAIGWLRNILQECTAAEGAFDPAEPENHETCHATYQVIIHTSRFCDPQAYPDGAHFHDGQPKAAITSAIRQWFVSNGLTPALVKLLHFHDSRGKPHADIYVDDKGFRFVPSPTGFEELHLVCTKLLKEKTPWK